MTSRPRPARRRRPTRRSIVLAAAFAAVTSVIPGAQQDGSRSASTQASSLVLDAIALDRNGAAVDDLGADDFLVTLDGVRRRVTSIRYVTRGPGAIENTRTLQDASVSGSFAAEPARTVVVVVDQTTLLRGDEKATIAAVRSVIDRLGLDDRIGILRLPVGTSRALTLDTDRPLVLASLRGVMGQVSIESLAPPVDPFETNETERPVAANPERAAGADPGAAPEQPRASLPDNSPAGLSARDDRPLRGNLHDLQALLGSLRPLPGRKAVILFSAGLTGSGTSEGSADRSLVEAAGVAAARAHAVVYAFGLKGNRLGGVVPDARALETLARATGGQFAALDRNTDQAIGLVLADLSSCYVLGLEASAAPDSRTARTVNVAVSRPSVTARAPGWLVPRADAGDVLVPRASAPGGVSAAQAIALAMAEDARLSASSSRKPATPAEEAELRRLLARAADYVESYQREYSSLVAEEDYEQLDWTAGAATKKLRLKSDLLLVRPESVAGWVSFRDVYEVDGKPVRERDLRLQRLFLDPSVEARARLSAILFESARYNIGPVRRTINTPLFPLTFLERALQIRFLFTLGETKEVDGVRLTEVGYRETASPTIALTDIGTDQPSYGRFLIDPVSGTVVESRTIYARAMAGQMEYQVRYLRDDKLGLWLPSEMKETYRPDNKPMATGMARYRNFRRFQVTTDTSVTVPK